MRSNVENWKNLQDQDYFEKHGAYGFGLNDIHVGDVSTIESFLPLRSEMIVAVIGCGYGRETVHIARRVRHVYGIDVSHKILDKFTKYTTDMGVTNVTPVVWEQYVSMVPDQLDIVFSIVVMQHLTRDLVEDYFRNLSSKLKFGGQMLIQFLDNQGQNRMSEAEIGDHEPAVSWTRAELQDLAARHKLIETEIRTYKVSEVDNWHWVHLTK